MLIAKEKRKNNIAEYVLYLWQIEDLLRALNFDEKKVRTMLVDPMQVDEAKKQEAYYWYMGIAGLLKDEGKEKVGHTSLSLNMLRDLNDIHLYLLDRKKDEKYRQLYFLAQSDIRLFKEKMGNEQVSDIEACFHALYSRMLLGLKKEEVSGETQQAIDTIARLVAYLSAKYHRYERGEESMDDL